MLPSGLTRVPLGGSTRRRRSLVVGASALGHLTLFALMFSSASGGVISAGRLGGGAEDQVFAVDLVPMSSLETHVAEKDAMTTLRARLSASSASDVLHVGHGDQANRLNRLAERLAPHQVSTPDPSETRAGGAPASAAENKPSVGHSNLEHGAKDAGEGKDASTGALWGQIAPCWRGLGAKASVAVRLEVSLDGAGRLREPPKILRTADARLDDLRLRAEERALAALAACMPRNDVRFGGRTYSLDFPAAGR